MRDFMTRMNGKMIAGFAACFAVGVITGNFFPMTTQGGDPEAVQAETAKPIRSAGNSPKSPVPEGSWILPAPRRERPVAGEGADGRIEVPASLLEAMSRSRSKRGINQDILDNIDPAEKMLGLTEAEKAKIESAWQSVCDDLRSLEKASLKATDQEDGAVRLSLPDLSNRRGELAESFKSTLTGTLGQDRGEAFHAIKQVEDMLASGAGERSITVKTESVGEARFGYRMTLEDASGQRVWVGENIPDEIRHLTDAAGIFPTTKEAAEAQPQE